MMFCGIKTASPDEDGELEFLGPIQECTVCVMKDTVVSFE